MAYGFNPEGGTKNYSFSTYDSHSELHDAIRLSKGYRRATGGYFLRAESFYNVATAEMLSFDNGRIHSCEYEETDSYRITKMFLDDREQILGRLL